MKRLIVAIAIAVPFTLGSANAIAGSKHQSDCAKAKKAKKACVIDFSKGDNFEGARKAPNGDRFVGKRNVKFGSLLRPRLHWHDNIVKTANRI